MQFTLLTAAVAIFATGVVASNCKTDLYYCGSNLMNRGDYRDQIDTALRIVGRSGNGDDDLFLCEGGSDGAIRFVEHCPSDCVDGGTDHNDYC
ncbi:hypothetical protein V492_00347 [Pseudogymnoascus sp. VKM F-4246]|nr:hypothetical protein V492_00347 [Pseudogymnoascus sp. VKM F-4246]